MLKRGFTLFEVMISVAIIGMVLTSLASFEIALMKGTVRTSLNFDRLSAMIFFLQETSLKIIEKNTFTTSIKELEMSMTFERVDVPKGSSLKALKDVKIERVVATHKHWTGAKRDTVITFKFKPKEEDEEGIQPP